MEEVARHQGLHSPNPKASVLHAADTSRVDALGTDFLLVKETSAGPLQLSPFFTIRNHSC